MNRNPRWRVGLTSHSNGKRIGRLLDPPASTDYHAIEKSDRLPTYRPPLAAYPFAFREYSPMLFRLSRAGTRSPFSLFLLAVGASLVAVLPTTAQQPLVDSTFPSPRLLNVSPCGAKAGTVVEVTCAGTDLEEPEKLLFSVPGFKAELVAAKEPEPKKAPMGRRRQRRNNGPTSSIVYKVTVPPDAPLGVADVRIAGKWGVSNARALRGRRFARSR